MKEQNEEGKKHNSDLIKSRIEIAYAIHDYYGSYYEYLGVSMVSVMENTKAALDFHVLCDATLTASAREQLTNICESYDQRIYFYDIVLDERISKADLLKAGYSEGILYRLYLPDLILDIPKMIYLDADILAHGDIQDLWNVDVEKYAAAGRWDPPLFGFKPVEEKLRKKCQPFLESMDWEKYINSGVLVLNLEKIKQEHHLLEEAISFWERYGMILPDQDAINYIFRGEICFFSADYNMPNKDYPVPQKGIFYHYSYMAKDQDVFDPIDKLYLSYWEKTPFYRSDYGKKEKSGFLRRLKNSIEVYERLRELQILDREEALNLGDCLYANGEFQKAYDYLSDETIKKLAIPSYGAFAKRQTKQVNIWELNRTYIMAKALKALQRRPEAVELLRTSLDHECSCDYLEHDVQEMDQWNFLGELLYEEGRYEEAENSFKKCLYFGTLEKKACAISALFHLVKCTLRMEKIEEAKKYYTMLYTILPLDDNVKICGIQIELSEKRRQKREEVILSKNFIGNATTDVK